MSITLTDDSSLLTVTSAEGKRKEGNAFVFFCLRVQALSCEEFMFPVQQVWTGYFIDIAKALEKKDLLKP